MVYLIKCYGDVVVVVVWKKLFLVCNRRSEISNCYEWDEV